MKSAIKGKGFTLIELLIVIIIIGILATLAIPQYTKMVEKSRTGEAKTVLGSMRTGEELYYAENQKYTNSITDLEKYVSVPVDTSVAHYFKYQSGGLIIGSASATNFNITATRKTGSDTGKPPNYSPSYNISLFRNGYLAEGL